MRHWKSSLLVFALAALSLAQSASDLQTDPVHRIGDRLACLCGSCNNTVATCQMLECHYSKPARQKIAAMVAAGKSDQEILDSFVAENGLRALAAPPAEGFNLLGWIMPFLGLAAGFAGVWYFLRRMYLKRAPAPAAGDEQVLSQYRERIEKDLAKLD